MTSDVAALTDRLTAALSRCRGMETLSAEVFQVLGRAVPFTFGCVASTDPLSGVVTWAFKSAPLDVGDEEWAATEYGEPDVNQFADIARRDVPLGLLVRDTGGRPELCRRFRDFLAPRFGFTDEVRLSLRARGLIWGAVALYRGAGDPPFSAGEASTLLAVAGVITDAIRRTLFSAEFVRDVVAPEPAVIIVDDRGRPRQMTRAARDRIEDLGGWDNGSLPAGLLAVTVNARTTDGVFAARTQLSSGQWLILRGSRLEGAADVVVTIDPARPAELGEITLIGLGLTSREQEIAGLVVKGASTKAIAGTLHLSPHTVQDHLKAIFAKLGINSRRQLISQLYG